MWRRTRVGRRGGRGGVETHSFFFVAHTQKHFFCLLHSHHAPVQPLDGTHHTRLGLPCPPHVLLMHSFQRGQQAPRVCLKLGCSRDAGQPGNVLAQHDVGKYNGTQKTASPANVQHGRPVEGRPSDVPTAQRQNGQPREARHGPHVDGHRSPEEMNRQALQFREFEDIETDGDAMAVGGGWWASVWWTVGG